VANRRHPNPRRLKIHRSYTVERLSADRLANRRGSLTFDFKFLGLRFTTSASRFDGGELGELFSSSNKAISSASILASDRAIAISLALQHGCPLETLRRALCRDARGNAASPLGAALDRLAADEGRAP
jgi:hypothetical protein